MFWVYSNNKDKCVLNRKWWVKLLLPSDPSSQGVAGDGTMTGWALRRIEATPWRAEGTQWKNLNYSLKGVCEWTLPAHWHISLKLLNFKICGSHSNANAWPSALPLKINDIKKPAGACCRSCDPNHCHYALSGGNHSGCAQSEHLLRSRRLLKTGFPIDSPWFTLPADPQMHSPHPWALIIAFSPHTCRFDLNFLKTQLELFKVRICL